MENGLVVLITDDEKAKKLNVKLRFMYTTIQSELKREFMLWKERWDGCFRTGCIRICNKKLQFGSFMFKVRLLTCKIWLLSVGIVFSGWGLNCYRIDFDFNYVVLKRGKSFSKGLFSEYIKSLVLFTFNNNLKPYIEPQSYKIGNPDWIMSL